MINSSVLIIGGRKMAETFIGGNGSLLDPYHPTKAITLSLYIDTLLSYVRGRRKEISIFRWREIDMWLFYNRKGVTVELAENPATIDLGLAIEVLKNVRQEVEQLLIHQCE